MCVYNNSESYHCSFIAGTQCVAKGRDSKEKSNMISLFVMCIRLKDYQCDILVTMNSTLKVNEKSQVANAIDKDKIDSQSPQTHFQLFKKIMTSFRIKDLKCVFG